MAFQSPTAFIQRRSLLAAFENSEALPSRNNPFKVLRPPHKSIVENRKVCGKRCDVGKSCKSRAPPAKREFPAPVFASFIKVARAVVGGIVGESGICSSPHVRTQRLRCGTAGKITHSHANGTSAPEARAFKLRRQNAPRDDLKNARTASTRTTAARPVKILRNDRFQDKKIPPRALNA